MLTYTFFLLDGPRPMPEFIIDEFPDPDTALAFARDLLTVRDAYDAIEIVRARPRSPPSSAPPTTSWLWARSPLTPNEG